MRHLLITGINGFIARNLADALSSQVESIHGSIRKITLKPQDLKISLFETGDLSEPVDWGDALEGVDTVFHLAGTVHSVHEPKVYNRAIVHGTKNLVEQAIKKNVSHFVYVSSAAVYGKENCESVLTEKSIPTPNTPYGEAKLAAENELIRLAKESKMSYTIVRPPIVTGKNAPGNVAKLKKLIQKLPVLPFGSATEKRSLVNIDTLVNFLIECANNPNARSQIFNITDKEDMSTRELCLRFANELNKKIVLLPIPPTIMRTALSLIGQRSMYDKLFGQLRFSIEHAQACIRWNQEN